MKEDGEGVTCTVSGSEVRMSQNWGRDRDGKEDILKKEKRGRGGEDTKEGEEGCV